MPTRSLSPAARRPITGRTVLFWMVGFFGLIFAANTVLIYFAVESFPGLEVASSYKAGQQFNGEVAAAEAQAERGWTVDLSAVPRNGGAAIAARFADRAGDPERGLTVEVRFEHPTHSRHDRRVTLAETGPGTYAADLPEVAAGRWTVVLTATSGGEELFHSRNVVVLAAESQG
jgi:nitrogen fixation protein FixH